MNPLYTHTLNDFVEDKRKNLLFSSAKISIAFFLVLLSIPVTSVAIC